MRLIQARPIRSTTPVMHNRIWASIRRFFADMNKALHNYKRPPHA